MLIFGYDEFIDGEPTTNGFKFTGTKSPVNLGLFGYRTKNNIKDSEVSLISKVCSPFHPHHHHDMKKFFDIEVKKIDEIKDKYYYVIDVFPNEFWESLESRYPDIGGRAISDIKNGRAKILVLFPLEPLREHTDISGLFNTWVANYNLPSRSIVVISGNHSFGNKIKKDKCITYIPYSMWEHLMSQLYSDNVKERLISAILNKTTRKKVFLSYNRMARPYRCRLVYLLQESGALNSGFVSLGNMQGAHDTRIPDDFYEKLPMTFDDTDLEINHASELIEKDFLDSYVSLVSETDTLAGNVFPTEKIFKAIMGIHPFIVLAAPGFLEMMKGLGYKTFSRWFNESYDAEPHLELRTRMIISEIKKLTIKPKSELQDMLVEMLPHLKHNLNNFLERTKSKEFQKELESELWR